MAGSLLNRFAELGVKPNYLPWEKYLTRKLNYYSIICIFTGVMAILSYIAIGNYKYVLNITGIQVILLLVVVFNIFLNYAYALYVGFAAAAYTITVFSFVMGYESGIYLFFFPLTMTFLTLLNRFQSNIHVAALRILMLAFVVFYVVGIKLNWFPLKLDAKELVNVRIINFSFSSLLTLLISTAFARQNAEQENELLTLIKEKEVLLAEVHHRVKNNMAIISSLLNLRQETCNSDEARAVLEDCKNRIYSMALIHKNLYGSKPTKYIDMQEYITELGEELVSAYAHDKKVKLHVNARGCNLYLDNAIPCGFIINELITNSLKYALVKDRDLEVNINLRKMGSAMHLLYFDNGPGFETLKVNNTHSLGMTLIELLCQQMEAKFGFKNETGLVFNMDFPLGKSELVA
jgi:two-component sensor histidine kinase